MIRISWLKSQYEADIEACHELHPCGVVKVN